MAEGQCNLTAVNIGYLLYKIIKIPFYFHQNYKILHNMLVLPVPTIQKAPGAYAKDFTLENLYKFIIRKQHLGHNQDIH